MKMTEQQKFLTRLAANRPGLYRVGWYAMHGEPYHVEGCHFWRQVSGHRTHGFHTPAEAEEAGHPPAKCCAARRKDVTT